MQARTTMSLTGTLSELALCDLVEITTLGEQDRACSTSPHTDGSPAGRLAFRDGALVSASCGALVGRARVLRPPRPQGGQLRLRSRPRPRRGAGDDLPTGSLLMEAMRRVDEIDSSARRAAVVRSRRVPRAAAPRTTLSRPPSWAISGPGQRSVGDIVDGALVDGTRRRVRGPAGSRTAV